MRDRARLLLGRLCLVAGAALLIPGTLVTARGLVWQKRQAVLLTAASGVRSLAIPGPEDPVARLIVRRLGIDAVVAEGTGPGALSLGPGHLEGSALPGESDNCIIAGHRDGVFGRLRSVRRGDIVEIIDRSGSKLYRVVATKVVDKGDTTVLASSRRPILTLVTCYPFHYVGPAPRRFIVRAELIHQES